jgi:hypothetical protein
MVEKFKQSKFFLCVAQKMNYEDGIAFTENNIVSYLAELEEYISSLITYTAFKRDDPNAAISAIPLDKLENKDHAKKPMTVDPPHSIAIDIPEVGVSEGINDEAIYSIIDPRELYAKFQELYDNNHLTIQRAGHKNQNNAFHKDEDDQSNN